VCLNGILVVEVFRHDLSEIIRESIDYGLAHVLAHGEKGEQLVADVLASAYPPAAPRKPVPASRRPVADAAETEKLAKWASRLEAEFPKLDLRHTQMQDLKAAVRLLPEFRISEGRNAKTLAAVSEPKPGILWSKSKF
jgi:hypothetical protein